LGVVSDVSDGGGAAHPADLIATAIALVTAFASPGDGTDAVIDMLHALTCGEVGQTDFNETFKVVQGLLGLVAVVTDWYSNATGISHDEVLRMIAEQNELRRP
jgi:hypothetical protein